MTTRPPITEELKRKVFVEAGHRCAIPTCKNPDVDIHHIIPWEKCQEHSFNNLIALCPNCHRRSHNGEIDRKSLLMYKAQLVSLLVEEQNNSESVHLINPDAIVYEKGLVKEEGKLGIPYSVEIEYPRLISNNSDFIELNKIMEGDAFSILIAERKDASITFPEEEEFSASLENAYASSFKICLLHKHLISIKRSMFLYRAGAAHSQHACDGLNYFRNPLRSIGFMDLFDDSSNAISMISDYCIKQLELENHDKEPNNWVREGACPQLGNFDTFYITEDGISIIFQPYQVGCYADGEREVHLTSRFLKPLIWKDSILLNIWGYGSLDISTS